VSKESRTLVLPRTFCLFVFLALPTCRESASVARAPISGGLLYIVTGTADSADRQFNADFEAQGGGGGLVQGSHPVTSKAVVRSSMSSHLLTLVPRSRIYLP
jgi:hypothetical protein